MRKDLLSFFILLILILIITFPFILKITTHIPGFFSTDEPFGVLWNSWNIKYSFTNKTPSDSNFLIAYPFGHTQKASFITFVWSSVYFLLSIFTTPVLTFNIQVLLNIILIAVFTYYLSFYLTKNRSSALLSAVIFSFCPYQFSKIWQHLGLTYNQWLIFCLLSVILLREKQTKKYKFLFLGSLLLLYSFDFIIMYFGTFVLGSILIYCFAYRWKLKLFTQRNLLSADLKYFKIVFLIIAFSLVVLSIQFAPLIANTFRYQETEPSAYNAYHRPFNDLFEQSARPLSYFLPAVVHPVFGKFTEKFIGSSFYGVSVTEHTLYLGWVPIILAFIAFRRWKKRRKQKEKDKDDFYIGFFLFLAFLAWLFSQPPWWNIGPLKIYMPSFFMYKVLPMFRAYCRFGIVVMLAVSMLAGYGLKFILEKFKNKKIKIFVTGLFCILVLFEFWNWPPYKVIDVSKSPKVYSWLKNDQDKFAIAEYPLDTEGSNELYKFYQTFHHKPIINGTTPGTYPNRIAKTIEDLSREDTASILKWMGVKYVLVHKKDYEDTELIKKINEFKNIPQNKGLKFVKSFPPQACPADVMCIQQIGQIDVYEVVAKPLHPEIKD